MLTLTVTRNGETFRFHGKLPELIQFSKEWETAVITDFDGVEIYSLPLPAYLVYQAS